MCKKSRREKSRRNGNYRSLIIKNRLNEYSMNRLVS